MYNHLIAGPPARHLLLTLAVLLSTGCQTTVYTPYGTPSAPPAVVAPVVPQAQAAQLNGVARYFGAPLQGAMVKAYMMGRTEVVATATASADGKFRLEFPAGTPQGALVKLVATDGTRTVATVATVPQRQVQQANEDAGLTYILDEERSMVFLVLGRRLDALGDLSLGNDGVVALSVAKEAFAAFTEALAAVKTAAPITREAYQAASENAFNPEGQLSTDPKVLQAIASLVPADVVPVLAQHADSLAVLIREEVASGKPLPKGDLVDKLPVGDGKVVEEVFPDTKPNPLTTSGGSGGGSAPLKADPTPDASGTLDITDGELLNPPASASLEVGD